MAGRYAATDRNRNPVVFGLATFLFLGPLGVGVALLATRGELDKLPLSAPPPEKRPVADGRRRFICPRCGVDSDIKEMDTSYECWRCGDHWNVKPRATDKKG
jgi:DNA-directed RNA polymerase subunit RPC12/RpoP